MIEPARRHGPFDLRFHDRPAGPIASFPGGPPAGLGWEAFSALLGEGRERHDLAGIRMYRASEDGDSPHTEFHAAARGPLQIVSADERAEVDAENEGMPPIRAGVVHA